MNKESALKLLSQYIKSNSLINHSKMVAFAMESYALSMNKDAETIHNWWLTGLLHDLDWEQYPDQHPNFAVHEVLPNHQIHADILQAILSHAPGRTGVYPSSELDCYLFACDEISGFIHAVSLMRPTAYDGMKVKSVTKKLKTINFAANVSREDIDEGVKLIETTLQDHIQFLISVFQEKKKLELID